MRITLLLLAAGILFVPHANASSHDTASHPEHRDTITVTDADDSMSHWSTCANPACAPGGKGIPVATNQIIHNATPSIDGASMLVSETVDSKNSYTNVLWPYKTTGCDTCTQMQTDFWVYLVSSSHVATLEYDAFLFDATNKLNIMWGMQWNQERKRWQIWNEGTGHWVDTTITTGPTFGAWNHIQIVDHREIGDTSCDGTECLHYDSLTLNDTTYTLNLTEPAGPLHRGWHSVTGFQFQLDATPVTGDPVTLTEYIDKANMSAH